MKKKYQTLIAVLSLIFVLAVVISCRKNESSGKNNLSSFSDGEAVSGSALQTLKDWHTSHTTLSATGNVSTQSTSKIKKLQPLWDKAKYTLLADGERVIVVDAPGYKLGNKNMSFARKFIFKRTNDRIRTAEIVEFYSNSANAENFDNVLINCKSASNPGFDGFIMVYDINYHFLYSQVYKNGQITKSGSLIKPSKQGDAVQANSNMRVASTKLLDEGDDDNQCLDWWDVTYDPYTGQILGYVYLYSTGCTTYNDDPNTRNPPGDNSGTTTGPTCSSFDGRLSINSSGRVVLNSSCLMNQVLVDDSLKKKYPCFYNMILNQLNICGIYPDLIAPFMTGNAKPSLTWQYGQLAWNSPNPITGSSVNVYELGHTNVDPTSGIGQSQIITLNEQMLKNSSTLMIAAATIHETFHAYIAYQIATADFNVRKVDSTATQGWCAELDHWLSMIDVPNNTNDHGVILSDYFCQAVDCLQRIDNFQHTDKEYAEAMLFGLNTHDVNSTAAQITHLDQLYNNMLSLYNISSSDINNFNNNQIVNVPSSLKLPGGCPI